VKNSHAALLLSTPPPSGEPQLDTHTLIGHAYYSAAVEGEVGVDASRHITTQDFTPVIERALALPGFHQSDIDAMKHKPPHTVGYGHASTLSAAGPLLSAIDSGILQHIFLIGGCDGNEPQRKYYQNLHREMPETAIVLTLGCGKFRLLGQDWGNLGDTGLPRLLDMGQCNDAYAALVVATELAKALKTDIGSLPLSLDISWFEQKAVAVLLTLLSLGVKRVRLGPKLPAFLTPDAVALLQERFELIPANVEHPGEDLQAMMANL
jgi:hydroxylamine reductase